MKQKFLNNLFTSDLKKIAKKLGIDSTSKKDRNELILVLATHPYNSLKEAHNQNKK